MYILLVFLNDFVSKSLIKVKRFITLTIVKERPHIGN